MYVDDIDIEAMRPAPKELTGPQLAWRAKKMTTLKQAKATIRAAVQPGFKFVWPNEGDYAGQEAEYVDCRDEDVYIKLPHRTQNFGVKRFIQVLQMIGKLPQ